MTDADRTVAIARSDRHDDLSESPTDALVTAHSSAPGRTVLTEAGNTDAWIASSLVVDLPR